MILNENLTTIKPEKLKDVKVLQTYVEGKQVFKSKIY
ncbi:hypothetical protein [Zobellia laminariae]